MVLITKRLRDFRPKVRNLDAGVSASHLQRRRRQENGPGHMEDFQLVLPFDAAAKHLSGDHAAGQNCARSHKREGTGIETKIDEASKGAREAVERRG